MEKQDTTNFDFLMALHARFLEGRPLGKCTPIFNNRGRNGKGTNEKILMHLLGAYFVPVKPTVFHNDTRNENEHTAADLHRKGARLLWFNETTSTPWSNAVFKNKNSSDPVVCIAWGEINAKHEHSKRKEQQKSANKKV